MFSVDYLHRLRTHELERVARHIAPGARVLEIGAGTGQQAALLAANGFDVLAVELETSNYSNERVFPIRDYDGKTLPAEDASVDVVFSSNVLEHVEDLQVLSSEIRRVLRPNGCCIHVVPTPTWRLWSTLAAFPAALQEGAAIIPELRPRAVAPERRWRERARLAIEASRLAVTLATPFVPRRHGERGSALSELWLFRAEWWRKAFADHGFAIVHEEPMGLFYTGSMVFAERLPLSQREHIARVLGSACHLFKVTPKT